MTLLPPNASPLERALERAVARLSDVPVPLRDLWNPDTCPAAALPYLAYALSIDDWSSDWPDAVKRARVRTAIPVQRMKGTAGAVRAVVASFGGRIALQEWWQMQPRGLPHTFALAVDLDEVRGVPATAAYAEQIIAAVARTKPARSHFTFTQAMTARADAAVVARARPAVFARLTLAA